jgi:23S rRNA (uridine2552-2'-O)-methyltransferase
MRSEANYRSRSAFKLVQINEQYKIFPPLSYNSDRKKRQFTVVDLGCAPGGWTQASLELLGFSRTAYTEEEEGGEEEEGILQVVGVDLIQTEPLLGARFLQGNFLDEAVQRELRDIIKDAHYPVHDEVFRDTDGVADLIISDMAPNLSGNKITDIEASLELCRSVLAFAQKNLRRAEKKGKEKGYSGSLV